jgi:prolyl oligopeptidase
MKAKVIYSLAIAAFVISSCNQSETTVVNKTPELIYPATQKINQVDDYFGTLVADPFRWLEDENSEETKNWVTAQNELTFGYLKSLNQRDQIKARLNELWNYPKYSAPFKKHSKYYFYKNDGIQNQSILYMQETLESNPKVVIDPNKFSEDGTSSLTNFTISKDGKYAAYGVSKAGSDWKEFFVLDLDKMERMTDQLKWIKFSGIAWHGNGFYYTRYDAPKDGNILSAKNEFAKVYYHRLGDPQEKDQLIHQDTKNATVSFYANTTEDEKFLVLSETKTTSGNGLYYKRTDKKGSFIKLADGFDYDYSVIDNDGDDLLILTNEKAPRYKLVKVNTNNPNKWTEILPQKEEVLSSVTIAGGKIIATYMKDVTSKAYVYNMEGRLLNEIALNGLGIINSFNGRKTDNEAFYTFSTFTAPPLIFKYNVDENKSELFRKSEIKFNSADYETKQVFYNSKDGTKIPMFIVHKKGLELDGNNPTMLYGYGGFNISVTPSFKVDNAVFLENGGIYAVANIRGGGEYGKDWHQSGTQLQKQNVFDDFIAAAEYLINQKYTSAPKLAISGRSNGGLLVGAVMTQRPDLFKVALPGVGVLDMLRYHTFTIGYAWATDYGRSDEEQHFHNLIKYSPLHNVKEVSYPATMVTTADHDDRVVPAHSYKFISAIQEKHKGENPVLIRIDVNAGHGAGKPVSMQIEEAADVWAFVFHHLGVNMK